MTEEVVDEELGKLLVIFCNSVQDDEIFFNETSPTLLHWHPHDPRNDADDDDDSASEDPKPKEDVDLLVQHVHGQDTHEGACDWLPDRTPRKIAPSDAWEHTVPLPILPLNQINEERNSESGAVSSNERFHDKELNDGVDEVKYFDEKVYNEQEHAGSFTDPKAWQIFPDSVMAMVPAPFGAVITFSLH